MGILSFLKNLSLKNSCENYLLSFFLHALPLQSLGFVQEFGTVLNAAKASLTSPAAPPAVSLINFLHFLSF
jgi:hypothetical protein